MIKLWVWRSGRSTTVGDDMNATRRAQANLDQQIAAGTHNPATQCACGTWRTPGVTHKRELPKIGWCSK